MRGLIVVVISMLLTGCAGTSKFDCPAGGGVRCQSISKIDSMVTDGSIENKNVKPTQKKNRNYIADKATFPQKTISNAPTRTTEQVLQLWVAPYESADGIYYQQAFLNVVVKNGGWIMPVVDDLSMVE